MDPRGKLVMETVFHSAAHSGVVLRGRNRAVGGLGVRGLKV